MGLEEEVTRLRRQNRRLKAVVLGFAVIVVLFAGGAVVSAIQARAQQARAMDAARRAQAEAQAAFAHARAEQQELDASKTPKE